MSSQTLTTHDTTTRKVLFLKNHSARQTAEMPFEELIALPSQHGRFVLKADFVKWGTDASTDHVFWSLVEPRDPGLRVSGNNEPRRLRGFVADLDCPLARPELQVMLDKFSKAQTEYPVAFCSTTFSGCARLIWLFERPVTVFGQEHAEKFYRQLVKDTKVAKFFPGLDEKSADPSQHWELGRDWANVTPGACISSKVTDHLSYKMAQKLNSRDLGPSVPLDVVEAEVQKKFPNRWTGSFAVGSQGPRFWSPEADSPTGCWIRENGVYAFTGEGRFLPWAEILGQEFVRGFEQGRISNAVGSCYYNGGAPSHPYCRQINGVWQSFNTEVFRRHLVSCGLSKTAARGEGQSEVDKALHYVEESRYVDNAGPFVFDGREVVDLNNKKYLNTSRVAVLSPLPSGPMAWGEKFPWIAQYLETLFDDEQRNVFLSWLSRFYQGGLCRQHNLGQALVVAGPANSGKTFLSRIVIGGLMGGFQEAGAFLTGKEQFNASLFETGVWTIDDFQSDHDAKARQRYVETLKKHVANYEHTYRAMYQGPFTTKWHGRIVITMNEDEDSIGMLPSTDSSAGDKLIFLRARDTSGLDLFGPDGGKVKAQSELAAFAAYLRYFEIPEHLRGGSRFGVIAYKNEFLQQKADDNNPVSSFIEVIDKWRGSFFITERGQKLEAWEGTGTDLLTELMDCATLEYFKRSFISAPQVTRSLGKATRLNLGWLSEVHRVGREDRKARRFRIANPKVDSAAATQAA